MSVPRHLFRDVHRRFDSLTGPRGAFSVPINNYRSSPLLPRSLDALDPNAYDAFKASRNLGDVVDRVLRNQEEASNGGGPRKLLRVEATLMTPVQPMLVRTTLLLSRLHDWRCDTLVLVIHDGFDLYVTGAVVLLLLLPFPFPGGSLQVH